VHFDLHGNRELIWSHAHENCRLARTTITPASVLADLVRTRDAYTSAHPGIAAQDNFLQATALPADDSARDLLSAIDRAIDLLTNHMGKTP
jgi:hypothetical protein